MREEEIIAFIESGELEAYLLGVLSPEDEQRVEQLIDSESQIRAHFESLEGDLATIAQQFKKTPPAGLKDKIMDEVSKESQPRSEKKEAVIIPMQESKSRLNIAASVIVLILGGFLAWNMYQTTQLENALAKMQNDAKVKEMQIADLMQQQSDLVAMNSLLADPQTQKVLLEKQVDSENLYVAAFWNNEQGEAKVYTGSLPALPEDKCYQMWADVDGEMLSVGILEEGDEPVSIQYYADATSLNITVEKAGGSDHATVANLVTNAIL